MISRFFLKNFEWNNSKNNFLKNNRGIGFEDILLAIYEGNCLKIEEKHYNDEKYPNQKILYVNIENYVYIVPFLEDDEKIFLKTVIPSRKYTKKLLG